MINVIWVTITFAWYRCKSVSLWDFETVDDVCSALAMRYTTGNLHGRGLALPQLETGLGRHLEAPWEATSTRLHTKDDEMTVERQCE